VQPDLKKALERAALLGHQTTALGANLYGHVPHIAPEAWLHIAYRGLTPAELSKMEVSLGRSMPASLSEFFASSNGISLFSSHLDIYGLRSDYARTGDARWQPFDIIDTNITERPRGTPKNWILIGSYFFDGSFVAIDTNSEEVFRLAPSPSVSVVNTWKNLNHFISTEVTRLSTLFDDHGHLTVGIENTVPN